MYRVIFSFGLICLFTACSQVTIDMGPQPEPPAETGILSEWTPVQSHLNPVLVTVSEEYVCTSAYKQAEEINCSNLQSLKSQVHPAWSHRSSVHTLTGVPFIHQFETSWLESIGSACYLHSLGYQLHQRQFSEKTPTRSITSFYFPGGGFTKLIPLQPNPIPPPWLNEIGAIHASSHGVYVTDIGNHQIIKLQSPEVKVIAGVGAAGYQDGPASLARFQRPRALESDAQGNLYLLEVDQHRIRKIDPKGNVTTLAGGLEAGFQDGPGDQARFNYPFDLAVSPQGDIYVSDTHNHRIRKITSAGIVSTVIGTGQPGFAEGANLQVPLRSPMGIDFGPDNTLYIISDQRILRTRVD